MFLYLGSLKAPHPSPNGQSQAEEMKGEAGRPLRGRWRAVIAREEDLVITAAEGTFEKQINRVAVAALAEAAGRS